MAYWGSKVFHDSPREGRSEVKGHQVSFGFCNVQKRPIRGHSGFGGVGISTGPITWRILSAWFKV